jgi:bifunctional non-homologous end joining protein LigD
MQPAVALHCPCQAEARSAPTRRIQDPSGSVSVRGGTTVSSGAEMRRKSPRHAAGAAKLRVVPRPKRAKSPAAPPALAKLRGVAKAALPRALEPQKATLVAAAPGGDDWLHELKYDGYRMLAAVAERRVRLVTRSGLDWTERMPTLAGELERLRSRVLIDGEIVVLDREGISNFQSLQNALGAGKDENVVYYAFDLLHMDGYDLRELPLEQRKELLSGVLASRATGLVRVRYSDHVIGNGPEFHRAACVRGLEGTIAKRRRDPYRSGRTRSWLKIKCLARQEFVVVGFTEPAGSRTHIGALLLAVRERERWAYVGKVGTGFSRRMLEELRKALGPLAIERAVLADPPRGAEARDVTWVRPELVVEVEYTAMTDDRHLRHPTFRGVRRDKAAREVVLERPKRAPK